MEAKQIPKKLSLVLASLAILLGFMVILGWIFKVPILIQLLPNLTPMQFNTALLMLLCGVGIVIGTYCPRIWTRIIGGAIFLFAFLTLLQYIFQTSFHIDELFYPAHITTKTTHPGRMAPNTAMSYITTGLAIFYFYPKRNDSSNWISSCLAVITLSFGVTSLLGYILGVKEAYGWETLTNMAIHTSIGFLLLGCSIFIGNITFDREGKFSSWMIIPLLIFSYLTAVLIWRSIEIERLRSIYTNQVFYSAYLLYLFPAVLVVFSIYLQKKSISLTNRLEEAKFEATVNSQMKSTILHYVSHELRNPLNAVIGFSEPFLDQEELPRDVKEGLDCIFTASMHMKSVVDDLLAVSRFSSGKIVIDSHDYQFRPWIGNLTKALKKRAEKQNIHFLCDFPESMPETLKGDSLKIGQIIINLTENAFKYTPQEGNVKVSIWLDDHSINPLLHIKVEDTGRGIPKEVQDSLFQPFFQVANSDVKMGLGLGLSICKEYLNMMGGTIEITSEEGKGTTFLCKIEAYLNAKH